jgi:HEAT repeat protein
MIQRFLIALILSFAPMFGAMGGARSESLNPPHRPTMEAINQLIQVLKTGSEEERRDAAYDLGALNPEDKNPAMIPALLPLLKDPNPSVRSSAADVLGSMEAAAQSAVPALIPLLTDTNPQVRNWTADALGRIGASVQLAIPQLTLLLTDPDPSVVINAARALGNMGESAKALPPLIALLSHSDPNIRNHAITTLGTMGALAKLAIPKLFA